MSVAWTLETSKECDVCVGSEMQSGASIKQLRVRRSMEIELFVEPVAYIIATWELERSMGFMHGYDRS